MSIPARGDAWVSLQTMRIHISSAPPARRHSGKIVLAAYLFRSLRTNATAPIPVASNVSVMGSGTLAPTVLPANAGTDKAIVAAESIIANLSALFTGYLLELLAAGSRLGGIHITRPRRLSIAGSRATHPSIRAADTLSPIVWSTPPHPERLRSPFTCCGACGPRLPRRFRSPGGSE